MYIHTNAREIITTVVVAVVITLEYAVSVSCSGDALLVLIGPFTSVLTAVRIGALLGVGVKVLVGVNINVCTAVMADFVEFAILAECS